MKDASPSVSSSVADRLTFSHILNVDVEIAGEID